MEVGKLKNGKAACKEKVTGEMVKSRNCMVVAVHYGFENGVVTEG